MDEFVIETHGLCRSFDGRQVIDNLNLRVPAGSVYGFLGPNGAGKTSTIRMLLGLLRPDSGSIRLFEGRRSGRAALARIGTLVESPSVYPHLTGEENLRHACLLKDVPRADISRVLTIAGLAADARRLVRTYSLGMRQRLGLAQALLGHPDLVILDEPTNGLDPCGIHEFRMLLRDMPAQHGITVFLSSHLLAEIEQVAGFLGILSFGQLQFQGTQEELKAHREPVIRIGVQRSEDAARILAQLGYRTTAEPPDSVLVRASGIADAVDVNRHLVERGFAVHSLATEQPSLEHMFLHLTTAL